MPPIDTQELLRWMGSIGAKLLLLAFLTPFLILMTASVFAIFASQFGTVIGVIAMIGATVTVALVLNHWLWLVKREKT
jgi:hypothetical protein